MNSTTTVMNAELPIGYQDPSGRIHREISLRKMTGVEEELLYDARLNSGQLVSALLAACTVQLGDLDEVDGTLVSRMYVADRNFALLELRRLTFGDRLTGRHECPDCGVRGVVDEDLSQIPTRRLALDTPVRDASVELEDGHRDEEGAVHRHVVLRTPRGTDEEFVAGIAIRDPLRARDALMLRCIRSFGELPQAALDGYGVELLRSLTLGDRRRLGAALDELTLGPDFRRSVQCAVCSSCFESLLDASSFFEDG